MHLSNHQAILAGLVALVIVIVLTLNDRTY